MLDVEIFPLSMIWWNVNLSPPIASKRNLASDEKIIQTAYILEKLMLKGYSIICLGEVSNDDIRKIIEIISNPSYSSIMGAEKQGRLYFDTAILYNINHVDIVANDKGTFSSFGKFTKGSKNLKIFEMYIFRSKIFVNERFYVFLSHWPSKLRDTTLETHLIAHELSKEVDKYIKENKNVILMGDYNLEPYELDIVENLLSSRDKDLVLNKDYLLFNPCWYLLTLEQENGINGTYFYNNGQCHKWRIIDQIMISKSFLTKPWNYKRNYLEILEPNELFAVPEEIVNNPSDHYPLSNFIYREL